MVDCASSIRKKVRRVAEVAGELEMTEILSTMVAQKFVVVLFSENQLYFIGILQVCHHCSPDKSCCGGTSLLFLAFHCLAF